MIQLCWNKSRVGLRGILVAKDGEWSTGDFE